MGRLIYGGTVYELEDRLLAHLQFVVTAKLRRSEKFFVSWRSTSEDASGRESVWLDNGMHIAFHYDEFEIPRVNHEWLEAMGRSAATNFGLQLTDEDGNLLNMPIAFGEPDEI